MSSAGETKAKRLAGPVQRKRILRAAADLFAEQGYHGTGIEELSQKVELGRGALYHHIGSKEKVLAEICRISVSEMIAIGEKIKDGPGGAEERFRKLAAELMRNIAGSIPEWTVFFRDYIALSGPQQKEILGLRRDFEQIVKDIVDEGMESGELRRLDPIAIKGLLGQFNYSYLWVRSSGRLAPEEIAEIFCDSTFLGLRA
ncbi:MAG TPA: TetR/AcrR family transcriptional regulator [Solirubrobacterales bacterium]|nr:TetR/AcrR family transcriptional regulator [Solirubrobacterales bacterium]